MHHMFPYTALLRSRLETKVDVNFLTIGQAHPLADMTLLRLLRAGRYIASTGDNAHQHPEFLECKCGHRMQHTIDTEANARSEEHTSELQSLMRTSYAVFCLKTNNSKIIPNQL